MKCNCGGFVPFDLSTPLSKCEFCGWINTPNPKAQAVLDDLQERLQDYERGFQEGRYAELPDFNNPTYIVYRGAIYSGRAIHVARTNEGMFVVIEGDSKNTYGGHLGKSAFLRRSEAQAALLKESLNPEDTTGDNMEGTENETGTGNYGGTPALGDEPTTGEGSGEQP